MAQTAAPTIAIRISTGRDPKRMMASDAIIAPMVPPMLKLVRPRLAVWRPKPALVSMVGAQLNMR